MPITNREWKPAKKQPLLFLRYAKQCLITSLAIKELLKQRVSRGSNWTSREDDLGLKILENLAVNQENTRKDLNCHSTRGSIPRPLVQNICRLLGGAGFPVLGLGGGLAAMQDIPSCPRYDTPSHNSTNHSHGGQVSSQPETSLDSQGPCSHVDSKTIRKKLHIKDNFSRI